MAPDFIGAVHDPLSAAVVGVDRSSVRWRLTSEIATESYETENGKVGGSVPKTQKALIHHGRQQHRFK